MGGRVHDIYLLLPKIAPLWPLVVSSCKGERSPWMVGSQTRPLLPQCHRPSSIAISLLRPQCGYQDSVIRSAPHLPKISYGEAQGTVELERPWRLEETILRILPVLLIIILPSQPPCRHSACVSFHMLSAAELGQNEANFACHLLVRQLFECRLQEPLAGESSERAPAECTATMRMSSKVL